GRGRGALLSHHRKPDRDRQGLTHRPVVTTNSPGMEYPSPQRYGSIVFKYSVCAASRVSRSKCAYAHATRPPANAAPVACSAEEYSRRVASRSTRISSNPAIDIAVDKLSPVPNWKNRGQTSDFTRASTTGKIPAQPHRSRRPQTAAPIRPPGFNNRRIRRKAFSGSGTYMRPSEH